MNRDIFFENIKAPLFGNKFKQKQVDGLNTLLDAWNASNYKGLENLAYCLATAYHETAHTMQPIAEYGKGRGKKYGKADPRTGKKYYGRGYVQLTWYENYEKARQKMGVNFVSHPDQAMKPEYAAHILYTGMFEGWFTKYCLGDYIYNDHCDYRNARRIVNGLDKATQIKRYAEQFESAIVAAELAVPVPEPEPTPEPTPEPDAKSPWWITVIQTIVKALLRR
jgi:predicted chitinase